MNERSVERRVVTALFVDVVGSTRLTVELGPERVKRALDRAFMELAGRIEAEGGTVEKYVGDAIHAIFGAPVAHADDSQRALRAAYACVQWAAGRDSGSVPFSVRVGVESGEAIVDLTATVSDRQQMSVGACVNVAARLQQAAEPGHVLVGPACHAATLEIAEFAPVGDLTLKGMGATTVWRLARLGAFRVVQRVPFVGREAELDVLRLAYRRASSGHAVLALVTGPPGQGKTRLVEEFVRSLAGEADVRAARCRPAGELGARSPLNQLLGVGAPEAAALELSEQLSRLFSDPTERHRVQTALAHSAGVVASLDLAALPSGQRHDEIANGWRRYLTALARARPVVLFIDDLQWADAEVVQLLDRLTLGGDARVLVIGTARPELTAHTGLRPGGDRFFVSLDALDDTAAHSLACAVGAAEPVGIERAEGNPLFIIELARAASPARDVPITLHGVIGARLDELAPPDREMLQRAAVAGDTFSVDDAVTLAAREPSDVVETLQRLSELGYLHRVHDGVRFHHALVRDVAYARLTTTERMRLHARYARDRVAPHDVEALAHHLWEAVGPPDADWVWEGSSEADDLRERAGRAQIEAARHAANRFAYERALDIGRRGRRFARGPRDIAAVEQTFGDVYQARGDADDAWRHYLEAREVLRQAGIDPPAALYPSLLEMPTYTSGMFRHAPDPALVDALATEGEAVARRAEDVSARARLLALRAYSRHDPAGLDEALSLSEQVTDDRELGSFLSHAAILEIRAGEFDVARRIYERLDAASSGGAFDRHLEFRAILELGVGRVAEAARLANEFMNASASRGAHLQTHAYRERAHVLLARADWPGLLDLAAETNRLQADHPHTAFCYAVTTVLGFATIAHAVNGRQREAQAMLVRAMAPLQSEPLERETVLLLAAATVGEREQVDALLRQAHESAGPMFWFFERAEAVAYAMLERWQPLEALLLRLPATPDSAYLPALTTALHEECAAARGGPPPTHRELRALGYPGWSLLLAHRPVASDT